MNWILKGQSVEKLEAVTESGKTLAKGSPVYSCYCYGGDELI